MSLDVHLISKPKRTKCTCTTCWKEHTTMTHDTFYDSNITHNLAKMADKAGIYYALWRPEERKWKKAKDIIPVLEKGIARLKKRPEYFKQFNPDNGWGSYEGLVTFAEEYLQACRINPKAYLEVSR